MRFLNVMQSKGTGLLNNTTASLRLLVLLRHAISFGLSTWGPSTCETKHKTHTPDAQRNIHKTFPLQMIFISLEHYTHALPFSMSFHRILQNGSWADGIKRVATEVFWNVKLEAAGDTTETMNLREYKGIYAIWCFAGVTHLYTKFTKFRRCFVFACNHFMSARFQVDLQLKFTAITQLFDIELQKEVGEKCAL